MQNLHRILIFIVAIVAIFFLASEIGEGSFFWPTMLIVGAVALVIYLWLDNSVWLLIPVALINPISLAFLPVPFKATEVAFLLVAFYLVFSHAAMKHQGFTFGPANIWVPAMIILLIIVYHQSGGGLGLRLFGGSVAGARRHSAFAIAFTFYICLLSVWPKVWKRVENLPGFYVSVLLAGAIPNLFCIYFPNVALATGLFWFFAGVGDVMNFYMADIQRIGLWGPIGVALQLWLVSRYPIRTWFTAPRFMGLVAGVAASAVLVMFYFAIGRSNEMQDLRIVLGGLAVFAALVASFVWREHLVLFLSLVALLSCANSGFRSSMGHFALATGTAAVLALRWRVLFFAVPASAVLAVLVFGNNLFFELPDSVQRSLAFIPGRWDPHVEASANSSNDFRQRIRDLYLEKYAAVSPWFGNGHKLATRDLGEVGDVQLGASSEAIEGWIRSKDFHIGWISVYDCVGFVGSATFLWLCLYLFVYLYKQTRRIGWDRLEPVQVWVTCYLVQVIGGFFSVFGDMSSAMPQILFGAGLAVVAFEQLPAARRQSQPVVVAPTVEPAVDTLKPSLARS